MAGNGPGKQVVADTNETSRKRCFFCAEKYYEILQQYNLLDEEGNAAENWEIWLDGEQVTLDDIKALLAEEDCDLDRVLMVDGMPITLGEVKTILEIEEYIAYLRETYFTGHKWTAEQKENLVSLAKQIDSEGIMLMSANSSDLIGESGINHSARVTVSGPTVSGTTATFTATLSNGPESLPVSFKYTALSGSQTASGSGTVTFNAGEKSKTFSVSIPKMSTDGDNPVRSTASLVYYVKLDNITNALFSNNKKAMTVKGTTGATVEAMPPAEFQFSEKLKTVYFSSDQLDAINWGIINNVIINTDWTKTDLLYYNTNGISGVTELPVRIEDMVNISGNAYPYCFVYLNEIQGSVQFNGKTFLGYKGTATETITGSFDAGATSKEFLRSHSTSSTFGTEVSGDTNSYTFTPEEIGNSIEITGKKNRLKRIKLVPLNPTEYIAGTTDIAFVTTPDCVTEYNDFDEYVTTTAKFTHVGNPTIASVSAPAGTYYPGQVVPVTVTFSEPVNAANAKVKFNGTNSEYKAIEGTGYSNCLPLHTLFRTWTIRL